MINKRLLSLAAAGIMLLGLASLASAGIPDDTNSTATSGTGTVLVVPDGTGDTLGNKGLTISVNVRDVNDDPIAGYPFQDIWWDDPGNGDISLCQGGSVADFNTNATGDTSISGAAAAGGYTQGGLQVYLAGTPLTGPTLGIDVNSPDINGDLVVNLSDISLFAADLTGAYNFKSDFVPDGVINLSDIGKLGVARGAECP